MDEIRSVEEDCTSEAENDISMEVEVERVITASELKLLVTDYEEEEDLPNQREEPDSTTEGSRIFNLSLLSVALQSAARCSGCSSGQLSLNEKPNARRGWASSMYFLCDSCGKTTDFRTSRYIGEDKTNCCQQVSCS